MARISTYIKDSDLDAVDLIIGSEAITNKTINIPLRALGDFVIQSAARGAGNNDILTFLDGHLIPSSVTNMFVTLKTGSMAATSAIADSVSLTNSTTILIGDNLDVFDDDLVSTGSPIVVENNITNDHFYTTILSVDTIARTITIPAQDIDLGLYGPLGDLSNTITFIGHDGIFVDGSVTADNLRQRVYLTGAEYNALSDAGNILFNVEYAITDDTV